MSSLHDLAARFIDTLDRRDWHAWSALLHDDVVYEIPQTRERIIGRSRYLQFNQEYPGAWQLTPRTIIADHERAVVWFTWTVDDDTADAMAFFEVADELITNVTDFWPEPYDPPPGREHLVERY